MMINFVIPVYNEDIIFKNNANRTLIYLKKANFPFNWRLVFVVNGSSLKFENSVRKYAEQNKDFVDFFIIKKGGKGRAIKTYFDASLADVMVYMDMDLSVALENIQDLINPIISGQAELSFGSRMLPESSRERSWTRELSSKLYIFLSQIILVHDFSDLQCGFKAITKNTWNKVSKRIKNNDWFFDTELIYFVKKEACPIIEIPIDWSENRYDERKSKVRVIRDGLVFLRELIKLRLS